jgi:hypothetical protein
LLPRNSEMMRKGSHEIWFVNELQKYPIIGLTKLNFTSASKLAYAGSSSFTRYFHIFSFLAI